MRIAYFSPLPPQSTGVADYSQGLLPHLAKHARIELFVDAGTPGLEKIEGFSVHPYQDFERLSGRFDASVYHLGNDLSHEFVLETALRFPSFAVLHDVSLHPLVVALTVGRSNLVGYLREMGYAYGRQGVAEARSAIFGRYYRYQDFPLCQRIVDVSLGTIVHSEYAAGLVRGVRPCANVRVAPQGISCPETIGRDEARKQLGLDPQEFVVSSLGLATPQKRLEPALRAFARFRSSWSKSRFIVVGEVPAWYDLAQVVEDLGLRSAVLFTGRVSMQDFYAHAAASDACLALRYPTSGETSAAMLRSMSAGRPVVVSQAGSFAELPEGTSIKVPVDEGEEDGILEALKRLASDSALRHSLGQEARAYVERTHSLELAALSYCQFIQTTLGGI